MYLVFRASFLSLDVITKCLKNSTFLHMAQTFIMSEFQVVHLGPRPLVEYFCPKVKMLGSPRGWELLGVKRPSRHLFYLNCSFRKGPVYCIFVLLEN